MTENITVTIGNSIADVRFNRPEKRNAITGEMLELLRVTAREFFACIPRTNKTINLL